MNSNNATFRLLILNDAVDEAERLISMLNNSGRPVRAQHIDSSEGFAKLIEDQQWDLLIAEENAQKLKPADALKLIKKFNRDIPVILQTDREGTRPIVDGLKLGAVEVVTIDEDQHLLQVISRELSNGESRHKQRKAERRANELSRRNQQLLDSSRNAIAYIQDGMFLYANLSFAELLGYSSHDDLECFPVFDAVDEADHDNFKHFVKDFLLKHDDNESSELSLTMLGESGQKSALTFEARKDIYDDEECIQLFSKQKAAVPTINEQASPVSTADNKALEAKLEEIRNQDVSTGLYNRNYLIEKLNQRIDTIADQGGTSTLFMIGVEKLIETVQEKLGMASVDIALSAIADKMKDIANEHELICRFGEESFAIIASQSQPSVALARANTICQQLRDFVTTVGKTTMIFHYHIGASIINDLTTSADTPIEQAQAALEEAKSASAPASLFEPPQDDTSEGTDITQLVASAAENNDFKLQFQPILSLRGSAKEHYEVFVKLVNGDQEIYAKTFWPEIENQGLGIKVDRWVILETMKKLAKHRQAEHPNTFAIVNITKDTMADTTLSPWLKVAFKAAKVPPESIIFQVNESAVNDQLNVAKQFFDALSTLNCGTSINRFGCSLNPMNALKTIDADYIKIDGSFTDELQKGETDSNSLNQLVSELHQLGKISIVPYVENASILSKLWQSGVHFIQGHYLQPPSDEMDYDFDMES